ncbi:MULTISPECIES: LPXTG cell wall anchor domain-containing protein [Turicibacter]|uniref:LPXTG cell wall anchor domain-containing protein n=1 Tax=Turicibacter TaxID=191303 RepID=UPI0001FD950F|nr:MULTISPECIES: LPXTG cell wall anchor domain-containing protein [Turicibacter]EGC91691.1 LPXTG-motif cell wall anchor domain protein [Turicibacter sp. HGF1]MDB8545826.1 LPXTG cell wall anchor domain-containing protein [Turicibacter sanguinis]MDB8559633.1 LPXTG cell wall anchor domain-containing protein [Turicibacter sanguinis]MDB8562441.1 LPXTG cell wall anchor domain-containing protein [Turicibacter sanguinis]MDB8567994.1 LPXTG cell wall anchor domain-containing protein [Turicibacter sangui
MKKRLLTSLTAIFMVFMMSTLMVFANDTVEGNLTSSQFLSGSNENGVIKLSGNVTLSDSLKIDAKNYVIDLNGHTLTLTKDTNLFTNNANVTFKNGTINLDGIKGNADTILGVGNYGSSATLTLDAVNLQANNYKSPYALIYVYNNSTLNIENNSVLNAKNEKSLSGGVIKSSDGQAGKINITDSTLNFENAARGFVDGTINIKNSTVNMKGLANGINSSTGGLNLAVDNSEITITGSIGRALTVDGTNIKVKNNSALNLSNSLGDDILFKSEGKIEVDQSSQLNFKTIKLDESIKGTDLNNLIVSENYEYQLDEQGNLIITEKQHDTENNPGNETDIPQTGDDSNLYLMIGMAITSLTGLVYLKKTSSRKDTV